MGIESSKTIGKLEIDQIIEAVTDPRPHDKLGIMRLEVKVDGNPGWVTLQGNQGTMYLEPYTAYVGFMRMLEKTISSVQATSAKVSSFINRKSLEHRDCKPGALADAKVELGRRRPKLSMMQAKLDQLRKRVEEGKREHSKRE